MFSARKIHDPYYGHGLELSVGDSERVSYGIGFYIGFTDSLFKINLETTAPFDTSKLNSRGAEEKGFDLIGVGLKVAVLWVQVSIDFHRLRNWWLGGGMKDDLEALIDKK